MKYSIKTVDDEFYIGWTGEFITELKEERQIFDTKELAQWYIDNTNFFGELKLITDDRSYGI